MILHVHVVRVTKMLDITSSDALIMILSDKILVTNISSQLNLIATLPSVLFGNKTLTETDNMKLFKFVYKFIQESKRF